MSYITLRLPRTALQELCCGLCHRFRNLLYLECCATNVCEDCIVDSRCPACKYPLSRPLLPNYALNRVFELLEMKHPCCGRIGPLADVSTTAFGHCLRAAEAEVGL